MIKVTLLYGNLFTLLIDELPLEILGAMAASKKLDHDKMLEEIIECGFAELTGDSSEEKKS